MDFLPPYNDFEKRHNLSQLPAGGILAQNQQIIEGLDTNMKMNLLRKNDYESQNQQVSHHPHHLRSLDKIKERVHHISSAVNPLILDHEASSEKDLFSHQQSNKDGFFFQPDNIKTQTRQGQLKVDVKKSKQYGKSPFAPTTKASTAVMTAPGTSHGGHDYHNYSDSPDMHTIMPRTAQQTNDYLTEGPT